MLPSMSSFRNAPLAPPDDLPIDRSKVIWEGSVNKKNRYNIWQARTMYVTDKEIVVMHDRTTTVYQIKDVDVVQDRSAEHSFSIESKEEKRKVVFAGDSAETVQTIISKINETKQRPPPVRDELFNIASLQSLMDEAQNGVKAVVKSPEERTPIETQYILHLEESARQFREFGPEDQSRVTFAMDSLPLLTLLGQVKTQGSNQQPGAEEQNLEKLCELMGIRSPSSENLSDTEASYLQLVGSILQLLEQVGDEIGQPHLSRALVGGVEHLCEQVDDDDDNSKP
eukprot:c1752_g1_i1.p1 GENE.c1752_g1_i1~~c1752_g1_i1.p1  ORF type:complete len:283 (+),score=65.55 c1752_g1_i1:32-880(+)